MLKSKNLAAVNPALSRRNFIAGTAALGTASACSPTVKTLDSVASKDFVSDWKRQNDRVWTGEQYWANPLQDWSINNHRVETVHGRPNCNLHLLTHQLTAETGTMTMKVSCGSLGSDDLPGSAGFLVGIKGPIKDYRSPIIDMRSGIPAGISEDGFAFIGDETVPVVMPKAGVDLVLLAKPNADGYTLELTVFTVGGSEAIATLTAPVKGNLLIGNIALATNHSDRRKSPKPDFRGKYKDRVQRGKFWFSNWTASGTKLKVTPANIFGPILFSHFTLSKGTMKLTAQMPPLGAKDNRTVRFEIKSGGKWNAATKAKIDAISDTARFRIEGWDSTNDTEYRIVYDMQFTDGTSKTNYWGGTIKIDPVEKDTVSVLDISCNTHETFPNTFYADNARRTDSDFVAFVGDQFYEQSGGYGIEMLPTDRAVLDYQRRWYLHGWTWRELTKDMPSVCLPDDHDVIQGNIWGAGGKVSDMDPYEFVPDDRTGYKMPAMWVNMVHMTQTSHHPDAADPRPSPDGITAYFGEMTYGGISFAIISDRMYKSGPREFAPPPDGPRYDHIIDPNFDPKSVDLPGAQLLGERQLNFLESWATDWHGADMKAVFSATVFNSMATTHGRKYERLVGDYDSNAWPQTPRNKAVEKLRKGFAFNIAGDQHLPAVIQYGLESHRNGSFAFAGPAVNVGYPRLFEPLVPPSKVYDPAQPITGDYMDNFGLPMTVIAFNNGSKKPRENKLLKLEDRGSGLGIVKFNKPEQSITVQCWSMLSDPAKDAQFNSFPVTVKMMDSFVPDNAGYLPPITVKGASKPVFQLVDAATKDIIYTVRSQKPTFRPMADSTGTYQVVVSDPETGKRAVLDALKTVSNGSEPISVTL
ncbi:alkaline phosphatase D family protein [Robiginitomaculum antarcticum]|uniref:alkaline phosphatase D family protein n=1 Tax=Robiginitomaculum antarcticum TaxID=437507 RepID=UPI00036BB267|nr:alkaline phosphatase D family protein [Robiginitomaculum antarcticum]